MSIQPRFIPRGFIATAEQVAIQCSRHRISLVEANAGAAKTTTLALRIGEALARGLAPAKILALVFTSEARDVLRERLLELGVNIQLVRQINLYTLEDFSRLALSFWEDGGVPSFSSWYELKPMALEALDQLSLYAQEKQLDLPIRTDHLALKQFFDRQLQMKSALLLQRDEDQSLEDQAWSADIALNEYLWVHFYEQLRHQLYGDPLFRGPHDATYDLACAVIQQPELLHLLPEYRLIVIDELHDANEAFFQILRGLMSRAISYVVAVGDRHQVIDTLRAADASYLHTRFTDYFDSIRVLPLSHTFRHGPYLAYATAAFKDKKVDSLLPVETEILVEHYDSNTATAGADAVLQALKKWKVLGGAYDQCAVILRDSHQSIFIENTLMQAKIPYQLQGMVGYLQRDEILFLRFLLACVDNSLALVESDVIKRKMLRVFVLYNELELDESFLQAAIDEVIEQPQLLIGFCKAMIQRHRSGVAIQRFQHALTFLQEQAKHQSAEQALLHVCQLLDLEPLAKRVYINEHDARVVNKTITAFIRLAQQLDLDVLAFNAWCAGKELQQRFQQEQGVIVNTVAQAKGKEFPHVILPYLEQYEFPAQNMPQEVESNLFYVAITRTQSRLSLCIPEDQMQLSPFVMGLRLSLARTQSNQRLIELQEQAKQQALYKPKKVVNPTVSVYSSGRVDLRVSYADKDEAKALGARWDPVKRVWYVPPGVDPKIFARWH